MTRQLELDQNYVRWELSANIRGVKLFAQCITEEHKEKTVKHWTKMRAKNIQIIERPDAARLLLWRVRMPANKSYRYTIDFTIEARTKSAVQDKLLDNKNYERWQVFCADIEEVKREEDTLREELENAKQVEMFACEETPAIEQPAQEIAPVATENEQPSIEQKEIITEEIAPKTEPTTAPIEQPIQSNSFKSAEQFALRFRLACAMETTDHLNTTHLEDRLAGIREVVEHSCKTANAAFPHGYNAAAYGLWWVVNRRIIDPETYLALKAMTVTQLCELIHTMLVESGENAGNYAQWLMNRFKQEQPATQTVTKALYQRPEEHESTYKVVEVLPPSEIKHVEQDQAEPATPEKQQTEEVKPAESIPQQHVKKDWSFPRFPAGRVCSIEGIGLAVLASNYEPETGRGEAWIDGGTRKVAITPRESGRGFKLAAPIEPDTNLSSIEGTQTEKTACTKSLDTKINLSYNIDKQKTLTTKNEGDTKMNQIMTQPEIQLSGEQAAVLKIMEETKQHMFITGRAGAGKSVLLREFRQTTKKKIVVAAPTGIAALNVRGQTLHSLFKLPPQLYRKGSLTPNPRLNTLLRRIECLVIDEISMVRADIMDAIDERLRDAFKSEEPFGGIQVIMFGDCYQLPPVVEENLSEYFEHVHGGHFFFNALVWKRAADFKVYELTQVFRQKDPIFKDVLNAVRDGSFNEDQLHQLNARYGATVPTEGTVTLAPTNNLVTTINQRKLDQLEGKAHRYKATITGEMKKSVFPTEEILYLKKGAQVVMLKNDKDKRWVNGTVGKVEELEDDYIDINIKGITYTLERETWDEVAYTYDPATQKVEANIVSSFSQYPIRLAWALTIHKSQGQTYESVCIDLTTKTFAPGQMYVALSRCTSLEGLYLSRQVKPDYIIVDPKVKNFMSRVETIVIEEPPVIVEAAPVIEAAEEIIQIAQIQPSEAAQPVVVESDVETPVKSCGRKPKAKGEKAVKLDLHPDPLLREGLARLMATITNEETTDAERAEMVPHSRHKMPSINDVMMEALIQFAPFREANPGLVEEYESRIGKK